MDGRDLPFRATAERPVSPTVLARTAEYQLTFHPAAAQSKTLVITFGGQPSDLDAEGFGTRFALSEGWDTIYVAQRYGTQFQGLSVTAFTDAVASFAQGWSDVVCYGSSLGGYAALYYGGALDARILAGAPMFPGWAPLKLGGYLDFDVRHAELWEGTVSRHAPTVIYDPHTTRDDFLVQRMVLRAYPDANIVAVPFAGHTVLVTLSQARLLTPVVRGFVTDGGVPPFDPPGEGTAIWHGERGAYLAKRDPVAARAEFERSLALAPSRRVFNRYIQCLLELGAFADAQAAIDRGQAEGGKDFLLFPPRAKAVEAAGLRVLPGPLP